MVMEAKILGMLIHFSCLMFVCLKPLAEEDMTEYTKDIYTHFINGMCNCSEDYYDKYDFCWKILPQMLRDKLEGAALELVPYGTVKDSFSHIIEPFCNDTQEMQYKLFDEVEITVNTYGEQLKISQMSDFLKIKAATDCILASMSTCLGKSVEIKGFDIKM